MKAYEKQLKNLKKLKNSGKKGKDAKAAVVKKTRERGARAEKKAAKLAAAGGGGSSADHAKSTQLLERPKEYVVKIKFPEPTDVSPPIIEIMNVEFNHPKGPTLFENLNFGIGMGDRSVLLAPMVSVKVHF